MGAVPCDEQGVASGIPAIGRVISAGGLRGMRRDRGRGAVASLLRGQDAFTCRLLSTRLCEAVFGPVDVASRGQGCSARVPGSAVLVAVPALCRALQSAPGAHAGNN